MSTIAIIPARGGSKRVPRKNIRPFAGRPVIAFPIQRAQESGIFDRIVVSTDDDEIADIATSLGADVPFRRPAELSDDYATTIPVIAHATDWVERNFGGVHQVCCLYPTTPFLMAEDLLAARNLLISGRWDYCFGACEYGSPIFRSFQRHADGGLEMFFPEKYSARSQDLPRALHDAGQFYFGKADAWLSNRPIFGIRSTVVELPRWRVHDIDTDDDWRRAELVWNALTSAGGEH